MADKVVTQADIARKLSLSRSTVSRALAGNERIAPETREKVMREARRMGYSMPAVKLPGHGEVLADAEDNNEESLVTEKGRQAATKGLRKVIGLLRTEELKRFFSEALLQMVKCGQSANFEFEVVSSAEGEMLKDSVERCLQQNAADGLILLTREDLGEEDAWWLRSLPVPVVLFGRHIEALSHAVTFDDYGAGVLAARYLCKLGHRRIAYIPGPQISSSMRERLAGFRIGLERHGCYDDALFTTPVEGITVSDVVSGVRMRMHELLMMQPPPTAVWVLNDLAAGAAIATAQMAGFTVPGDISVMGFDHVHTDSAVSITTFNFNSSEMARQAVILLQQLHSGKVDGYVRICVAPTLIEGDSTGPAVAAGQCHNALGRK